MGTPYSATASRLVGWFQYIRRRNVERNITMRPRITVTFSQGAGCFWMGAYTGYGKVRRIPSVKIRNTMRNFTPSTKIYRE
jgi:hypothetical protein